MQDFVENNPVIAMLLKTDALNRWDKTGVRYYPDSLFAEKCHIALQEAGQKITLNWYFDGETGKIVFNQSSLQIEESAAKDAIKAIIIEYKNKS